MYPGGTAVAPATYLPARTFSTTEIYYSTPTGLLWSVIRCLVPDGLSILNLVVLLVSATLQDTVFFAVTALANHANPDPQL